MNTPTQNKDYRQTLKMALETRMGRNSSYSLRAFARDLNLHPARLSLVLSGKKGLSRKAAEEIATRLGLSKSEIEEFMDQVDSVHCRSKVAKNQAAARMKERYSVQPAAYSLSLDAFQIISDWYHLALVELLRIKKSQHNAQWLAKKLGITEFQVTQALERLLRLELIEEKDGRFEVTQDFMLTTDGIPSEAIKKAHEQILKKAIDALYLQPVSKRDFYSHIFLAQSQDLPEIGQKVRTFIQDLTVTYSTPARSRPGDLFINSITKPRLFR